MTLWETLIIFLKFSIAHGERNGKVIRNPYPGPDHHQKLTTFRWPPAAHACHVWSTSVTVIVSYPAHRTTEWRTAVISVSETIRKAPVRCHVLPRSEWTDKFHRRQTKEQTNRQTNKQTQKHHHRVNPPNLRARFSSLINSLSAVCRPIPRVWDCNHLV